MSKRQAQSFQRSAVVGDGSDEFIELLTMIPSPSNSEREHEFRELVIDALLRVDLDITVKREAGLQGRGTRIDLYAHYRGHDYLVTIKKGLSQQKIKTVIGEMLDLRSSWRPLVPGARTYCVLYAFGMSQRTDFEALMTTFVDFAQESNERHGDEFFVSFTFPMGKRRGARRKGGSIAR